MPDLATLRFLTPATGITALAIGVPILLLFYFLKLRRRPVRVSSVFLWQDAARDLQVNVPWRLIRPSWLLLLQLLVLTLLAGALARPVLDLAQSPAARTIIVIDASASMAANDAPDSTTRLDAAKSRAESLIRRLTDASAPSRITIIASAASPVVLHAATDNTSDRAGALAAINAIRQTDEPGDLAQVFQLLKAMTASPETNEENPETPDLAARVVFISDGGDAARPLAPTEQGGTPTGLGDIDFEFVRVGPTASENKPTNAAIVALAARRDYEDPALVSVFCAIENYAPDARTTSLTATLTPAGSETPTQVGAWPIEIPSAAENAPGRTTRSFDLVSPSAGLLQLSLGSTTTPDALASDNRAWIALQAPADPTLWIVRDNAAMDIPASVSLRDAAEAITGTPPRVLTLTEYESIAPAAEPADVIIFEGVRPSSTPPAPTISFGAGLPIPGLIVQSTDNPRPTQIAFWKRTDPLMRGVTFPGTTITSPRRITLPDTQAAGTSVRTASVVARGAEGPLIAEIRDNHRRVIVGFTLAESNWWKDPSFPVFMANAIEALAARGSDADPTNAGRVIRTGHPVTLPWSAGAQPVTITGPNDFTRELTPSPDRVISLGPLPFVGVYQLSPDQAVAASLLDPFESSLATRDTLSISGRSVAASPVQRIAPREIWHWFVLAAVALLAIEWWAYALRMRT